MMQKFHFFWNDGRWLKLTPFSRAYDDAMPRGAKHFRVGHFACVVGSGTFVSAREWDHHILDDPACIIERGSQYWESHKRDRLSQLTLAATMIDEKHPHYLDMLEDIKREREHFAD